MPQIEAHEHVQLATVAYTALGNFFSIPSLLSHLSPNNTIITLLHRIQGSSLVVSSFSASDVIAVLRVEFNKIVLEYF